eukprot:13117814-Ditylum_brightwellii.AAC.1
MRSGSIPCAWRFSVFTADLSWRIIMVGVTGSSFPVSSYMQMRSSSEPPFDKMWWMRLATALTGLCSS